MKQIFYVILFLITLTINGCGQRLSGTSEEMFEESKSKMEESLNTSEKENLEKALRVIAMHAMAVKWNEAEKYKGKSFNEISLEVVNNKTYGGIIDFAEDFLEKENKVKKENLEESIAKLQIEKNEANQIIEKLEQIKVSNIIIDQEESFGELSTFVEVAFTNTSEMNIAGSYYFQIEIYSISKKIKVDALKFGGTFDEGEFGRGVIIRRRNSLNTLIQRSRRLSSKFKTATFPITDLAPYDLEVRAKAVEITTSDGTLYEYPKKGIVYYDKEIEELKEQLKGIETLNGTLDELMINDSPPLIEKDKYKNELIKIRKKTNVLLTEEQILKLDRNLAISLPKTYEYTKLVNRGFGYYSFSLSDSLEFTTNDKNLIQFGIQDTIYKEYVDKNDKANGYLNSLKKGNVNYDFKETIKQIKENKYFEIIDTDESGYMYEKMDHYNLLRYFRIKDTHYLYSLTFSNLEECVIEFDRSKNMVLEL